MKEYKFTSMEDLKSFLKFICESYRDKGYEIVHEDNVFEVGFGDVVVYIYTEDMSATVIEF